MWREAMVNILPDRKQEWMNDVCVPYWFTELNIVH